MRFRLGILISTIYLLLASSSLASDSNIEKVFTEIYEQGFWDETGFIFSGSQVEITKEYMIFLQDFLRENQIKTVVDIGCGDWAFSRYIDWEGIQYTGIDIVKFVIERNQKLFAKPSIIFIHADAFDLDLPEADLLLCKDVLQHLSNPTIMRLIKQFHKFKHCLITNYVDPVSRSSNNPNIMNGGLHYIDLTKPPFNVEGKSVLFFTAFSPKQTLHIQEKNAH